MTDPLQSLTGDLSGAVVLRRSLTEGEQYLAALDDPDSVAP